ncbi:hypothetical protein QQ054_12010 [Oscillatoria amoena NRMC-F 0135]|nr:hypothetical protein [Oscillatoria amoena NRMC-F 0135]
MTECQITNILTCHLPPKAMDYCLYLWRRNPFSLILTRTRHTKVGDFSIGRNGYRISINHDLNVYQFLVTYVHEVAHLHVHKKSGRPAEPHGAVWKTEFRQLLEPLLTSEIFPYPVLSCLIAHMRKPGASTFSDTRLTRALRLFDPITTTRLALDDLKEGSIFQLRGRHFRKGKLRRTRFYCHEITTNRKYLVPAGILVEHVHQNR